MAPKRGVQYCQGWHFAKAMPPQEFMQWLANDRISLCPYQQPYQAEI